MKPESIAEIKTKLAVVMTAEDAYVKSLREDARAGVQAALKQFDRRMEKQAALVRKLQEMSVFEKEAYANGHKYIAGIDEVGRGPLAGPVIAAAVILPENCDIIGLNDSKQLSEAKREQLFDEIKEKAVAIGVGLVDQTEIDAINIYQASKKAMMMAVEQLSAQPDYLLVDAMTLPIEIEQESLIKGDARSISIAAASIIAKVTRDRLMAEYSVKYPGYGFERNAGYGTKEHLEALETQGITPIHRLTFAPVKNYVNL
ncbi:ribonuclease HII [Enterococcus sp. JM4C]|uniref:ribonuclease HII n=1 Tax=Candidatus Enterococcus huntleyi TaxID=1857217 RepID=UPI00137B1BBC|nr:ribonuclease HII [Enterococcus sp. JM4C]KAF1298052.1 ribonuclease HII [Enterococcus sp. JM4C]